MSSLYSGIFARSCEEFIAQKRAVGYRYDSEERHLRYFDAFTVGWMLEFPILSKELVEAWVEKRPHEAEKSRQHRVTIIREFARFLVAGGQDAYILPPQKMCPSSNFVPYIFTETDIARLFTAADQIKQQTVSPYIHLVVPVLLRILYGCGLRVSEALSLRVQDIDLESGALAILHSKFDDSRMVPMSKSLQKICSDYKKTIPLLCNPDAPFFPNREGHNIGVRGIYCQYRRLLWQIGISHGGRGNGPRLHDLRHTFAVHSMKKMVRNGRNIYTTSPVLSAYLGHKSLAATQKYLRITAEVYPDVMKQFEARFGGVVPGRCCDAD